jgi:hypothetical protein
VNRFTDLNLYWGFAKFFSKAAKSRIWQTPCSASAVTDNAISKDGKTRFPRRTGQQDEPHMCCSFRANHHL